MSPVAFAVADVPVYGFVLFLDVACLLGVGVAAWLGRQRGVPVATAMDVALAVLAAALAGARAQYVAVHWEDYAANPLTAFSVWEGGLALPGAITAGAVAAWWAARGLHLPVGSVLDAAAVGAPLAQAVGRLGCVAAGCAAGVAAPAGTASLWPALPDSTGLVALRFPSQYVESAAELALGLALLAAWRRAWRPGTVAALYAIGYGALRAALEPFRGDATLIGGLPFATWWAAALAGSGVAALLLLTHSARTAARLAGPPGAGPSRGP